MNTPSHPLTIGFVLFPQLTQLDLTAPNEVFASVPGASVHLLAESMAPVASEHGLAIQPRRHSMMPQGWMSSAFRAELGSMP